MYAIVDYKLVPTEGTNFAQLMKDGWIPHGNVTFNSSNASFQALMKYDTTLLKDAEERATLAEKQFEDSEDRAATAEAEVEELKEVLDKMEAQMLKSKRAFCLPSLVEIILLFFLVFSLEANFEADPMFLDRHVNSWGTYAQRLLA